MYLEIETEHSNTNHWWLYIPSERCGVNFRWKHLQENTYSFFRAELSRLLGENIPVA